MDSSWHWPVDLLTGNRLDILGKLPLARAYLEGRDDEWARKLFRDCLRALHPTGRFGEDGRKFSLKDYEVEFLNLLDSLKSTGFDSKVSRLPLSDDGSVWNGAHRIAAALAMGERVATESTNESAQVYDFRFFELAGLPSDSLGELAWEYAQAVKSSRAYVFSNLEKALEDSLLKELENSGKIFFRRTLVLSQIGVRRNLQLMYGHLDWFSESLLEKLVLERFRPNDAMRVTVVGFDPEEIDSERLVKEGLRRELAKTDFERAVHGADNWAEAKSLLEVWTSTNSLNFLNGAPLGSEHRVMNELKGIGRDSSLPEKGPFLIDAGASLEVQGVRIADDIDHVCIQGHHPALALLGDCHNKMYDEIGLDSSRLITDPRLHVRWGTFKFSSISWEAFKASSIREAKSIKDLHAIAEFLQHPTGSIYLDKGREEVVKRWQRRSRLLLLVDRVLALLPKPLRALASKVGNVYRSNKPRS
jgi:hypothetical protein